MPALEVAPESARSAPPRWKRVAIILNRESGTLAGLGPDVVAKRLSALLEDTGAEVDLKCVPGAEIQKALEEARDGNAEAIIVGGGDGTIASAASLLAGTDKPLGILPLGTFNLAARDVGMPLDWEKAAAALIDAPVAEMDLMDVGGKLSLCVLVLGFYPALQVGRPEYHGSWLVKAWHSAVLTLKSAASFPPLDLVLRSDDGREIHHRTRIALLANNDYEDLFGLIPRRRSLDAGYFTLYISTHRTRLGMIKSFLAWSIGRWKQDREITVIQAREIEIQVRRKRRLPVMRDGELEKVAMPLKVTLKPKALRVLAPRVLEDEKKAADEKKVADAKEPAAANS